jgi:hypothetical protein
VVLEYGLPQLQLGQLLLLELLQLVAASVDDTAEDQIPTDKNSWIYGNTMVMEWKLGIKSSGLMVQFFITNAKRNALQSIKCRPRILPLGHQQLEFQLKDAHLPSDNMSCCLGREMTDLQYTKTSVGKVLYFYAR